MEEALSPIWLVKMLAFLGWLVFVPGYCLAAHPALGLSISQRLGASFALGFCLFALVTFAGYLLTMPLMGVLIITTFLNVILLSAARKWIAIPPPVVASEPVGLLGVLSVLGMGLAITAGWYPRGDAAIHFQGLHHILQEDTVTHAAYGLSKLALIPDHTYDAYYILVAMLVKYSGIPLPVVWHYLGFFFVAFVPWALYLFLSYITSNTALIRLSLLSFFLLAAFHPLLMAGTVFDAMSYHNRIYLWLLLPVALAFAMRYEKKGHRIDLGLAAVVCAVQLFIHQSGFLFFYGIFGGTWLLSLYRPAINSRRMLQVLASTALVAIGPLLLKMQGSKDFIALASDPLWFEHYSFWRLSDTFYAFSIDRYYQAGMSVAAVIVVGSFFIKDISIDARVLTLVQASFLVPLLLLYNPFFFPWAGDLVSFVALMRMHRMPFYFLAFAIPVAMVWPYISGLGAWKWLHRGLSLAFLVIVVFLIHKQFGANGVDHKHPNVHVLSSLLDHEDVVLSDRATSTDIAAQTGARTLVIQFNGALDLIDIDAQVDVMNNVLYKGEQGVDLLREFGVDYIVVGLENDYGEHLAHGAHLEEVYKDQFYQIYKVMK